MFESLGKTAILALLVSFVNGCTQYISNDNISKANIINATMIRIDQHSINIAIDGNGTKLSVAISPQNASNKKVVWTSENRIIADVDPNGNVIPRGIGKTTISAATSNGIVDSTTIIVTPPLYLLGNLMVNGNIQSYMLHNNITTLLKSPYALALSYMSTLINAINGSYISGGIAGINKKYEPCYWLNGEIQILSKISALGDGYVYGLAFSSEIVASGATSNDAGVFYPCYWKGNVRTDLPIADNSKGGEAQGIAINNSRILIAGLSINNYGVSIPCYWDNGIICYLNCIDITKGGEAKNIYLVNGDIYITGLVWKKVNFYMQDGTLAYSKDIADVCYWKNGILTILQALDPNSGSTIVNGLEITNADIYVYGATGGGFATPCYWKNGSRFDLFIDANTQYGRSGQVTGMSIFNDSIYFLGESRPAYDSKSVACFWINNVKTDINTPINELGYSYLTCTAYND